MSFYQYDYQQFHLPKFDAVSLSHIYSQYILYEQMILRYSTGRINEFSTLSKRQLIRSETRLPTTILCLHTGRNICNMMDFVLQAHCHPEHSLMFLHNVLRSLLFQKMYWQQLPFLKLKQSVTFSLKRKLFRKLI